MGQRVGEVMLREGKRWRKRKEREGRRIEGGREEKEEIKIAFVQLCHKYPKQIIFMW